MVDKIGCWGKEFNSHLLLTNLQSNKLVMKAGKLFSDRKKLPQDSIARKQSLSCSVN